MKFLNAAKIISLTATFLAISACGSTEIRGGVASGSKVSISGNVCLMPIPDAEGPDGNSVGGSGSSMTSALRDELLKHKINVLPLEAKTLAEARSESSKLGCERMIRAKLTEWKDYATEWSGKGDSIALSAEMYDVQKMKLLSTSSFRKKASAVSFVSHSPERFETVVADNTIAKLFGLPLPGKK